MVQMVTQVFLTTSGGRSFLNRVDKTLWVCTVSPVNKLGLGRQLGDGLFLARLLASSSRQKKTIKGNVTASCTPEVPATKSGQGCKDGGQNDSL